MKVRYLVTAKEMKEYDDNTIRRVGIPAPVLMERAALSAAEYLAGKFEKGTALILAGMGNNGGDGLALARLLLEMGWTVEIWCVGDAERASGQWKEQRRILENYPADFSSTPQKDEYTIMVDALFGVGLSREVEGRYAQAIEMFQAVRGFKLALDLPSGVDADTGRIWGAAVKADATVTFGFMKRGLAFFPGCEYAGEVVTARIGITERSFFGRMPEMFAYEEETAALLPRRPGDGHKGTFGKILLVAGSVNMAGAALLAAKASYRMGAGMVKVITAKENRVILQTAVPEALLGTDRELTASLEWADAIVIGPGLGKGDGALEALRHVIDYGEKPLVIDADGLNLLAESEMLQEKLAAQGTEGRQIVLTPHVGELSRLMCLSVQELKQDLWKYANELARRLHVTVAAKDARTIVCREGGPSCLNLDGNNGMATAGSGDVLAGAMGTLLAQTKDGFTAASLAVCFHGRAGDMAAAEKGLQGCMAGDIAEALGRLCQ